MNPKEILRDILALADFHRPSWADHSAAITNSGTPTMLVADEKLRDKLKAIETDLSAKREERAAAVKARDKAKEEWASAEGTSSEAEAFKNAETHVQAVGEIDEALKDLQQAQVGTLKMLGSDPSTPGAGDGGSGRATPAGEWDSARLFADSEKLAQLGYHATSKSHIGNVELGQVVGRDAFAADVADTSDMRRGAYYGVISQLRRRLRVTDLLPTATMDLNTVPYTKESGSFTTAAGVKEGESKPEGAVTFTDAEATARTIAHWLKIHKQALADVSVLRGIIDSRLRYGVERKLEAEVLAGKGSDPELEGILHTSGLGVVKYDASEGSAKTTVGTGTYVTQQVLRAITTIFLADAEATGLVMHPTDWQTALLTRSTFTASAGVTGGSGEFVSGGPFNVTPLTLWGVPIVVSASMKENEVLAGDFEVGAQLFIREGVNVLLSDSDQDDFIKNRVTMLAEMRAALAVWRAAAFCKVWLTESAETAGN